MSGHIEIGAANRNSVNPGILGKAIQKLARLIQSIPGRLINKKRLAATGEQSPRAVELQRQKRLGCIGINAHYLQLRINPPVIRKALQRLRFRVLGFGRECCQLQPGQRKRSDGSNNPIHEVSFRKARCFATSKQVVRSMDSTNDL